MTDWIAVGLRCAVYADLALLFGLPIQLLRQDGLPARSARRLLAVLAAIGLLASGLALLALAAAMAGVAPSAIDGATLRMVALRTPPGLAFLVRFGALAAALLAASGPGRRARLAGAAAAGVALATIAWTGHGAIDDGPRGWLHLGADIAHLLAAAWWIGAIVTLLGLVVAAGADPRRLRMAQASLARFSRAGSALVGILIVTGMINGALLLGRGGIGTLPFTLYGRLLLLKLALFAGMLGLAAANRWRLTPRLAAELAHDDVRAAAAALRLSLACELALAIVVLFLVAWLGTLAPLPD